MSVSSLRISKDELNMTYLKTGEGAAEKENRKVKKMRRDTNIRGSREDSKN